MGNLPADRRKGSANPRGINLDEQRARSRLTFALRRIRAIAAAAPPFTDEQLEILAAELRPRAKQDD